MSGYPFNTNRNQKSFSEASTSRPRPFFNRSQERNRALRSTAPPYHPVATRIEVAMLSDQAASVTVHPPLSERSKSTKANEDEGNPELALLLNLPKDESVFYEWWKFPPTFPIWQADFDPQSENSHFRGPR